MSKRLYCDAVYNKSGQIVGYINRMHESGEDPEIYCELPCGHSERFFVKGKTDLWYVLQTKRIKALESKFNQ